jgi:hypothetical protein
VLIGDNSSCKRNLKTCCEGRRSVTWALLTVLLCVHSRIKKYNFSDCYVTNCVGVARKINRWCVFMVNRSVLRTSARFVYKQYDASEPWTQPIRSCGCRLNLNGLVPDSARSRPQYITMHSMKAVSQFVNVLLKSK